VAVDAYDLLIALLGAAFVAAAVLPRLLRRTPLSLPMVYVAVGILIAWAWPGAPRIDPIQQGGWVERLTELAVIVSLMSAGLKLDRRLGWRRWRSTWRLLAITMPLSILGLALAGSHGLGLPLAAAVLLGAVLAPTDPVLAASVQVGPPGEGREDEARFALTSEAGLNDGLAFPFVNLAVVLATTGMAAGGLLGWFAVDVVWKLASGVAVGAAVGWSVARVVFRYCGDDAVTDGFVALALTLFAYGVTELVHGYGFLGVFAAALVFRSVERDHAYHRALHEFSEQVETLLMAVLLIGLGAAVAQGLLAPLGASGAAVGLGFLLLVRPLAGWLGLAGTGVPRGPRAVIAVFGIRGIGTFYYLSHALNQASIDEPVARFLWALAGFMVLASIVLHGATATPAMRRWAAGR
jgi:NhaP-type Na+/H+ or K+/H+ antiporter